MTETGAERPVWPADSGPGDDTTREAVLARAFVRLADTLASDFDVVDFLHGLSADSVEILRAAAAGVHAEFSLPLTVGRGGIGTLDLCRDRTGMLSDEHMADALVAADIARDALLYQQYARGGPGLPELLATAGTDRIVIHQATGMIAAQLDDTVANALARLRAAAFASGRPMYDLAQDVVARRVRFDD